MTIDSTTTALDKFLAPYAREVTLENVDYENDTRVLRIRIREGHRFTVMDINPVSRGAPWHEPCVGQKQKRRHAALAA